jgi:hypothetical protein
MGGDWGYRFLLCGSHAVENSVFVKYGSKLAQLLRLPGNVQTTSPLCNKYLPHFEMFAEGYNKAYSESSPMELKGTFSVESKFLLYRAVFLPIMLQPNWSKQLILGSFNCRPDGAPK